MATLEAQACQAQAYVNADLNAASELEEGSLVPLILRRVQSCHAFILFWWLSRKNPELKSIMKPKCYYYNSIEQASLASC